MAYDPIYLRDPARRQRAMMQREGARAVGLSYGEALQGLRGQSRRKEADLARFMAEQDLRALAAEEEIAQAASIGGGAGQVLGGVANAILQGLEDEGVLKQGRPSATVKDEQAAIERRLEEERRRKIEEERQSRLERLPGSYETALERLV